MAHFRRIGRWRKESVVRGTPDDFDNEIRSWGCFGRSWLRLKESRNDPTDTINLDGLVPLMSIEFRSER